MLNDLGIAKKIIVSYDSGKTEFSKPYKERKEQFFNLWLRIQGVLNMQSANALEKRIMYEKMLAELSENAVRIDNIKTFLQDSIRRMGEILDVSRAFVFNYIQSSNIFECICGWDALILNLHKPGNRNFTLHIPWATEELKNRRIINYYDVRDIPGECYKNHLLKEGIMSTLNVPLFVHDNFYGFVGFDEHRFNRTWRNEDLYILTTAAQIITRSIENKNYDVELQGHRNILSAIFSSVQDAIITVDTDFRILESNKAAARICNINEEVHGEIFSKCMGKCSGKCMEPLRTTLQENKIIYEHMVECSISSQNAMISMVNCSPLMNANGLFLGAVLVIRDITRLTRLETALRERHSYQGIVGKSDKMQQMYSLVRSLNDVPATVLITGESGTGKEKVAHAVHYGGQRASHPFVKVNCAALAETLLESELFGHAKGAFTGADKDSKGRFEAADGGSILLDEIGDISLNVQLKLLRVLQEKEFERVGEHVPRKVDVRVIASTNKDLKKAIFEKTFREDLYYRLNVINVHVPPLRERFEDIPALVDHFCMLFSENYRKVIDSIAPEVFEVFMEYPWPGNVRELEHTLERAFVVCHSRCIGLEHIAPEIKEYALRKKNAHAGLRVVEDREVAQRALCDAGWNIARAARLLGVSRWTLYRRLQEFGLSRPKV